MLGLAREEVAEVAELEAVGVVLEGLVLGIILRMQIPTKNPSTRPPFQP